MLRVKLPAPTTNLSQVLPKDSTSTSSIANSPSQMYSKFSSCRAVIKGVM